MNTFTNYQIEVLSQPVLNQFVKIEILDFNYKILDTIEGVVESGSISINADNDSRKSVSLSMIVPTIYSTIVENQFGGLVQQSVVDNRFKIKNGGLIWLDKYIRIYIGIMDLKNQTDYQSFYMGSSSNPVWNGVSNLNWNTANTVPSYWNDNKAQDVDISDYHIEWFNRGIFIVDSPTVNYSSETNSLSLNGIDLMAKLTNQRFGQLTGISTTIPAVEYTYDDDGELISQERNPLRDAFIAVLEELGGIKDYYIAPIPDAWAYIPLDINIDIGGTVYDLLVEMRDFIPNWEMFFDNDGRFILQPIPQGDEDTTWYLDVNNTLSEEINVDFGYVKNHVVVYGMIHDTSYYVENTDETPKALYLTNTSTTNDTINMVIDRFIPQSEDCLNPEYGSLTYNYLISFKWLEEYNNNVSKLTIHYLDEDDETQTVTYNLVDFENTLNYIPANTFEPNKFYVIRYLEEGETTSETVANTAPFDFLSSDQSVAYSVEDNPNSPYYINNYISDLYNTSSIYYGGYTTTIDNVEFNVELNNTSQISQLSNNTYISFMPNTYNYENMTLTIYDGISETPLASKLPIGNISIVNGVKTFIPLLSGKVYGDYTIYYGQYKSITLNGETFDYFEWIGRLPTLSYVCSSGEFDSIYSNALAQERADYELYLHSNLNDTVTINTAPNYLLDVNQKVRYKNFSDGIEGVYLIKQMSFNLAIGSVMSITMMDIYE